MGDGRTSREVGGDLQPNCPLTQKKDRLLVQELTKDAVHDKLLISDIEFNELLANARG
jgi:hypothetical protein